MDEQLRWREKCDRDGKVKMNKIMHYVFHHCGPQECDCRPRCHHREGDEIQVTNSLQRVTCKNCLRGIERDRKQRALSQSVRFPKADLSEQTTWFSPETAPKGQMILADFGMPWPAVAVWSDYAEKWVLAELEWNLCDGKADPGFVTEYEPELVGWMELPEVKRD